jgi:hypothetical protein
MTIPLDLPGGSCRRPAGPTVVRRDYDVSVPEGIRRQATRLGATTCKYVLDLIVVVLGDERVCVLNRQGEQVGRTPMGEPVPILEDVPWPMASVAERTRAA